MRRSGGTAGLAFAAAVGLGAAPAEAWEYARWGMSADEVVRASASAAKPMAPPQPRSNGKLVAKVEADAQFDSIPVEAEFRFDAESGRLAAIGLSAEGNARCAALLGRLRAQLAEPVSTARLGHISTYGWRDPARNAKVTFLAMELSSGFRCAINLTDAARPD